MIALDARGYASVDGLIDTPGAGPWDGVNTGLHGGLGAVGVHVMLPDGQHRHLDSCHWANAPGRDGIGVRSAWGNGDSRRSILVWGDRRLLEVNHTWERIEPAVKVTVTVLDGAEGCWFKEPKVCANGFRFAPGVIRQLDQHGTVLRRHLVWRKKNPKASTKQMLHPRRRQVSLGYHGRVKVWCDDRGLHQWRQDVEHLAPPPRRGENYDARYCHGRNLRASWEFVRWPNQCGILFCAWTGGEGQHSCWQAGRPAKVGATYGSFLRVRFNPKEAP